MIEENKNKSENDQEKVAKSTGVSFEENPLFDEDLLFDEFRQMPFDPFHSECGMCLC
jgi:hypothetical protein